MELEEVRERLRSCQRELRRLGVERLEVFGSVARGQATGESDVDVLVTFRGRATLTGFMELRRLLESVLGRKVDLVTPRALSPRLRHRIEQELRLVA